MPSRRVKKSKKRRSVDKLTDLRELFKFNNINQEILSVVIIAFAVLCGLSIYLNTGTGRLGSLAHYFFFYICGNASYVLPFLLLAYGVSVFYSYEKITKKWFSILVLFTMLTLIFHLGYRDVDLFAVAAKGKGGGWLGALFASVLLKLLGLYGSWVIIIAVSLISLFSLSGNSAADVSKKIFNFMTAQGNKKETKQAHTKKQIGKSKNTIGPAINIENYNHHNNRVDLEEILDLQLDNDQEDLEITTNNTQNEPKQDKNVIVSQKRDKKTLHDKQDNDNIEHINNNQNEIFDGILAGMDREKGAAIQHEVLKDGHYLLPRIELLDQVRSIHDKSNKAIENQSDVIEDTLQNFGISSQVVNVSYGPAVVRYELQLAPGVKVSKILSLTDDLSLGLAAAGIRIEAPIPGKSAIGIEVPKQKVSPVFFREMIESDEFRKSVSHLSFSLGRSVSGDVVIADLTAMPHMLVAGATGSGKSVCVNTIICSFLYKATPDQIKLLLIDPKMVELNIYSGIPHLIAPVVIDPKKAAAALKWIVREMENRYKLFSAAGAKDIKSYNRMEKNKGEKELPLIVVVIDELADLMMVSPADVEDSICRLAQMARAAGIHLLVATQRPSVDVITGLIKANIPSRIAFAVSSQIDSRTIIDMPGAEKLLGKGDMLFMPVGQVKPLRVQGSFISEVEIQRVVGYIKEQHAASLVEEKVEPDFEVQEREGKGMTFSDELLPDAARLVVESSQASISFLQRRLRVGYARAARLIDMLEESSIISPYDGSRPREILVEMEDLEELLK